MAAAINEAANQDGPREPVTCAHQETENIGTFGAPAYQCTVCKAMVDPVDA
jgi:hypothetical protein